MATNSTATNGEHPPPVTIKRIDWTQSSLPEYESLYAVVLDNIFTAAECSAFLAAAEAATTGSNHWERAKINAGEDQEIMAADIRNCDRLLWVDREAAAWLWARVAPHVPELAKLEHDSKIVDSSVDGYWARSEKPFEATRLNSRLKFLKYGAGDYFKPHCDGAYVTPDRKELSFVTLHLYLNESTPDEPLVGGATTFHHYLGQRSVDVEPKIGRVLLFQHEDLLHSGQEVQRGVKLTMRTEVMYRKVD